MTLVSLFNALFWRELPVPHPKELVGVSGIDLRLPDSRNGTIPESLFASLDRAQTVFETFAGFERLVSTAVIRNTGQRVVIDAVSGRYFDALGLRPALGQFVGTREVDSVAPVATIGFRCWQSRFGADPEVIGQTFRLQGELMTVIGVAPQGFAGLEVGVAADVWVPASLAPRLFNVPPSLSFFTTFGRLRPERTLAEARSQIEALWPPAREVAAAAVGAALGQARDEDTIGLEPGVESAARGFSAGYRAFYGHTLVLLLLGCAIAVVLSCANLSGLLLARWSAREGDLAVQAALGASNGRLVSQVVGESLALSMIAVTVSVPLAVSAAKGLTLLLWNQPDASAPLNVSPDYRVLGLMVLLGCFVALCVSLLPACRIWSLKLTPMRTSRGLPGQSVTRWGRWIATAQVALSVPLLVTAWLVAVNLHRLEGAATGFRPDPVIAASLSRQTGIAPAADPAAYLSQVASALRAVPGIDAAALSWSEPLSFGADWRRQVVTGGDSLRGARPFVVQVSPGYFETLSVPLVAGRDFSWSDDSRHRPVAIVSQRLASALFPGAEPVGQRVRLDGQADRLLEVIGVVADARLATPQTTNQLFLFTALLQEPPALLGLNSPVVLLKSSLPASTVEAPSRRAIAALGRDDVVEIHSLQRTLEAALLRERAMRLGAFYFAGLTTLLVFVGLYAVLNLGVMRRIPEIGLRIALGASLQDIRRAVMRDAVVTVAPGLVLGVPFAFLAGRLIASALTLVTAHDATAFGAAIAMVLGVAVLSVLIPLRRATRITPLDALRSE